MKEIKIQFKEFSSIAENDNDEIKDEDCESIDVDQFTTTF